VAAPNRSLPPREKILRAASRTLAARGLEACSLRAIARSARLAPSSLYEHFPDRAAILEALARDALRDLSSLLAAACAKQASARERVLAAALTYLEFAWARPSEFELCFSRVQLADLNEPPSYSPLLPVIAAIGSGVSSGELSAPRGAGALELGLALWTQVHGMAVLRARYFSKRTDFEARASQLVALTLDAWRAPAKPAT
jgi:AcrR family transcriptional regulator